MPRLDDLLGTAANASSVGGTPAGAFITNNQAGVTLKNTFRINRTDFSSAMRFQTNGVDKIMFNLGSPATDIGYLGIAGISGDANDVLQIHTGGIGNDGVVVGNTAGAPTARIPSYLLRVAGRALFDYGFTTEGSSTNGGDLLITGNATVNGNVIQTSGGWDDLNFPAVESARVGVDDIEFDSVSNGLIQLRRCGGR